MYFRLVVLEKLKDYWIKEEVTKYITWSGRFCKSELVEHPSGKSLDLILSKGYQVSFDENGKSMKSVCFSDMLQRLIMDHGRVNFFVGPPSGFCDKIRDRFDMSISLSDMTTSYQIASVFAAEQLYRAVTIAENHPYHRQ